MKKTLFGPFVGAFSALLFVFSFLTVAPAGAQTCPTAGGGTTCFGGQLFCASNNQCYNDPRPCASNQVMNCAACGCVCDTVNYPCGGCTAPSSTAGASCSGNGSCPSGGVYANQCGVVGCPSGTTICPTPAPGRCVTDRTCPAGTSWDVCADSCVTPNVLLSPGFTQSGFVKINGEITTTAGNLRLDSASGANQGDVYFASGKALRVDGSGATNLTVGNWGSGGTAANLTVLGRIFAGAGDSAALPALSWTDDADTGLSNPFANQLMISTAGVRRAVFNDTGRVCVGGPAICAATEALVSLQNENDTNTMLSVLDLYRWNSAAAGAAGIGGSLTMHLENTGSGISPAGQFAFAFPSDAGAATADSTLAIRTTSNGALVDRVFVDTAGNVGIGTGTPGTKFDVAGTARMSVSSASDAVTIVNSGSGKGLDVTGGTANYGAQIKGRGDNGALDVAVYDHSSPDTVANVLNVRRGTTGTPAVGMGGAITFALEGPGGSHYAASAIGSVMSSAAPAYDLVFYPTNGATGTGSMRITSAGNVGIGTAAPAKRLDVAGSVQAVDNAATSTSVVAAKSSSLSAAGNLFYGEINNNNVSNTDFLEFQSGSTLAEKLRVSGSGQWILRPDNTNTNGGLWIMLGNINNPFNTAAGLDVRLTDTTSGSGGWTGLDLSVSGSGTGTGPKNLMKLAASGTLLVDRYGNVGNASSGTPAPSFSFDATTTTNTPYGKPAIGGTNGADYAYLHISQPHSLIWNSAQAMRFGTETSKGAGYVERMRITGAGNVGIGTASPSYLLDVNGTMQAGTIRLGGVSKSSWPAPYLDVTQASTAWTCNNLGYTAWMSVSCPAGYAATGGGAYSDCYGGHCARGWTLGDSGWQFMFENGHCAYMGVQCAKVVP